MNSNWPKDVLDFEAFLLKEGLTCLYREESESFGNKYVDYSNQHIGVRIVSDRGQWITNIADFGSRPNRWYDIAIIRRFLLGGSDDVLLSLPEQTKLIETNWSQIVNCFSPENRDATHTRLNLLQEERVKHSFRI